MTISIRSGLGARLGVAALGVGILSVVGSGAAFAAVIEDDSIEVSVEIEPTIEPGGLALTVAGESAALEEGAEEGTERVFTGTLPTVTVTDSRPPEDVPDGSYWYVLGSISDFAGDAEQPDILSTGAFGWYPAIVSGNEDEQIVAPGDDVDPSEEPTPDENDAFQDEELLFINDSSTNVPGSYSANAGLELRTPNTVEPGSYGATMTLSLFQD